MLPFNEFALAISAIIIAITSIIGVVLLSTSIFKMNSSLKKTARTIEQFQRPYLTVKLNDKNIIIHNTGRSQGIINSITINNSDKIDDYDNKPLNPEQSFKIKNTFQNEETLSVEITYHSENNIYKENISLR
ncbi:hypothetical protein [Companilactobacillus hulinensis]|uniref:hypothetical protein n=1 Tax=Companilactobacillus hulinensis TaxID=2486007 RepID=UPI000F77E617|nr:hypothetical protein [Companilactobacillus hulinensis]